MKCWLIIFCLLLCGCGGELWFTPNGHRVFYKSKDQQFSCYSNNCCWPYKDKVMICAQGELNSATVFVKVVPDN